MMPEHDEAQPDDVKQLTDQQLLDQIRAGVTAQMQQALEIDTIPQVEMHLITQSYLLLSVLDKLEEVRCCVIDVETEVSKLNPVLRSDE